MPRTVRVTAGDEVYVGGTITEENGADITSATIVLALVSSKPTADTSGSEPDVDESPEPSQRLVKMLVPDTTPVGVYQLWGRIVDTPEREWLWIDQINAV
ncbi:hypothetical protein [Humibacter sp. RRB41]|uniref:hypothetical protein n=1 Tax=Humibacter sp. RRB41 TaxID=2919946 RepID=UPI001FA977B4|nr:hypothetical protein [Humibacter sp. RRB41]